MTSSKSNTTTLCKKHTKEYIDHTPIENNASVCSCTNCNSFECFALRNKGQCPCNQGKQQHSCSLNTKNIHIESKSSAKTIKLPKTESVFRERVKKEITYESSDNLSTVKKYSKYSYNCVPQFKNREDLDDKPVDTVTERLIRARSATITYSRKDYDTNTAQLSAQIMNLPYKDFKESISYHKSQNSIPKPTNLSRFDILKRIKDAYKACSCKVCECLVGKTLTRNEFCKCKPCECKDCMDIIKNIDYKGKIQQMPVGCPCIRCDRIKDCKGVVKKGPPAFCDCDPCDCLKCSDSFTKPCNCQPCECIECRSYSLKKPTKNEMLVVASMREDAPQAYCQCSPCDCAECGQDYTIGSSFRREMGTGINRPVNCACDSCINQSCEAHDNNSCTCDVQKKLMRKPIEKDTRDYDIHRASVKTNVIENKSNPKNDTIAMFAAVGSNFPKFEIKNNTCRCGECECIVCSCKGKIADSLKSKQPEFRSQRACKCVSCECEICEKVTKDKDFEAHKNMCECNVCDCLKCDGLLIKPTNTDKKYNNKYIYKFDGDRLYCTDSKCQMCIDQNKFINETVYGKRNSTPLSCAYGNKINVGDSSTANVDYIRNKLSTTLVQPLKSILSKTRTLQNQSSQTFDCPTLNVDQPKETPVRKSTQVLISNKYHNLNQNIVQSYRRTFENKSSESLMSEKALLDLTSKISNFNDPRYENILPHITQKEEMRKEILFKSEKDFSRLAHKNTLSTIKGNIDNYTLKTSNNKYKNVDNINKSTSFTKFCSNSNYIKCFDQNHSSEAFSGILSRNIPVHENKQIDPVVNTAYLQQSKTRECSENDEHQNRKDVSFNLVTSLRNANTRLSLLKQPKCSFYNLTFDSTNINISPLKEENIGREITNIKKYTNDIRFHTSYANHNEDMAAMENDFHKIKHILKQAKAFSMELTKVLKELKTANENLGCKRTKKIKSFLKSNSSSSILLDSNRSRTINSKDRNSLICNKMQHESMADGEDDQTNKLHSSAYEPVTKFGSHNLHVLKQQMDANKNQLAEIPDSKNRDDNQDRAPMINSSIITARGNEMQENLSRHSTISMNKTISSNRSESTQKSQENAALFMSLGNFINDDKLKCRSDKTQKSNKLGSKKRRARSVIMYKKFKLKEALINLANNADATNSVQKNVVPQHTQCDNRERLSDENIHHDQSFMENKHENTSTSTNAGSGFETSRFVQPVQTAHGLENSSWSILRKNYLINAPYLQDKGFSLIPPLLVEVKDTIRAISRQPGEASEPKLNNEVLVSSRGNKALLKLQSEIIKLLDSSMLKSSDKSGCLIGRSTLDLESKDFNVASSQTCNLTNNEEKAVDCMDCSYSVAILKRQIQELLKITPGKHPAAEKSSKLIDVGHSGITSEKSNFIMSKCSRDTLKVKFLGLRRVSDHTVLIKWKAPRDVIGIQGYELLVDGRAVQKILSPTRCMAVVTCLPHTDKVLITIRTLVTAEQGTRYPSATIVYRTRAK